MCFQTFGQCFRIILENMFTLPLPSLLVCTPFTKGGGVAGPPDISKTVAPINLKFCTVLETSLNFLQILKLFVWCLLGYHGNSSTERCFFRGKKSLDFSRKYQYSNCYQIHNLKDNILKLFRK